MPRQSIIDLKNAIEEAPEMTAEHREEMLALVDSLAVEVESAEQSEHEDLRGAIALAKDAVQKRTDAADDHDLAERLSELEERAERTALDHPVVANILNAIARLI